MWGSQLTGRKEHWCPGTQESWHGDGIGTRLPVFQSQLYPFCTSCALAPTLRRTPRLVSCSAIAILQSLITCEQGTRFFILHWA